MPHCLMIPRPTVGLSAADTIGFEQRLDAVPSALSTLLHLPSVFVNTTGEWPSTETLPFWWQPLTRMMMAGARFPGQSQIVDRRGKRLVSLGASPHAATAVVCNCH